MANRNPSTLRVMTPEEIAWVAGILEGEGCFHVKRNWYNQPSITVDMTDEDILLRLAKFTEIGRVYGPYEGVNKPKWHWKVQRINDCIALCNAVLPWMGERRTEQINSLLEATVREGR